MKCYHCDGGVTQMIHGMPLCDRCAGYEPLTSSPPTKEEQAAVAYSNLLAQKRQMQQYYANMVTNSADQYVVRYAGNHAFRLAE